MAQHQTAPLGAGLPRPRHLGTSTYHDLGSLTAGLRFGGELHIIRCLKRYVARDTYRNLPPPAALPPKSKKRPNRLDIYRKRPNRLDIYRSINALAETITFNNLAKRIKRVAFGLTNWTHWRIRVLLYAGKPDWPKLATITPTPT